MPSKLNTPSEPNAPSELNAKDEKRSKGQADKTVYLTTPIYYVNDVPHIGHAYTSLAGDVLARFRRLQGRDVFFLTGTDEHGLKVENAARKANISPKDFTDRVSDNFRKMAQAMDCRFDDFIRTTQTRHHQAATRFWQKLVDKGHIYSGFYKGWYSVREESFIANQDVIKNRQGQYCSADGEVLEWVEEKSYFFRLSQWQEKLLAFYRDNPDFIAPENRRNEVISFVRSGLKDLSISRTGVKWGIPVPDDPSHVMYVWIDALINYLTATGYPDDTARFSALWPADVHIVGKDILRFHAVYWPALLMAAEESVPKQIFAHGWWTNEGQKISKSLGNTIDPFLLVEECGVDALRYFLLREVPFGKDGDFSRKAMVDRVNGDLVHGLGNLARRVLTLVHANCDGRIPQAGDIHDADKALIRQLDDMVGHVGTHMDNLAFSLALEAIWQVVAAANRYIDFQAPWRLKKDDRPRMGTVLYVLYDALRRLCVILTPFLPRGMAVLASDLGLHDRDISLRQPCAGHWPSIRVGDTLPPTSVLYPRLER